MVANKMQPELKIVFHCQRNSVIKARPPIHDLNLKSNKEKFAPRKHKGLSIYGIERNNWWGTLRFLIDCYGRLTSVHGLDRICQRRTGRKERIFWMFSFFAALYLLIGMYALISERYRRKQFQTTLNETFYPNFMVPFPEVAICNEKRLNWARLDSAMDQFMEPEHRTPELETLFVAILKRFDTLTVFTLNSFRGLEGEPLGTFDYINFTNVIDFMVWRCEEILKNCTWREKSYDCCEIFFPRRFSLGKCLAFNSILTPGGKNKSRSDPYWPWRYKQNSRGSGLTVRALLKDEPNSYKSPHEKGLLVMGMEPGIFTDYSYRAVKGGNNIFEGLGGSYVFFDDNTRSFATSDRMCMFKDETESKYYRTLPGLEYNYENCLNECHQQHILSYCNCTLDLFFPPGPYPICKISDMPCLAENSENYDHFSSTEAEYYGNNESKGMDCSCMLSCGSLRYENKYSIEAQSKEQRAEENETFVDLDFHWRLPHIICYRTSLVFTWLDLLVSFGGIASLLLGCSLISFVELLYFLFCDAPGVIRRKYWSDKRLKELKRKQSVKSLLDYDSTH